MVFGGYRATASMFCFTEIWNFSNLSHTINEPLVFCNEFYHGIAMHVVDYDFCRKTDGSSNHFQWMIFSIWFLLLNL